MTIIDKETRRVVETPEHMLDHGGIDAGALSRSFSMLLAVLLERKVLTEQDVVDIVPNGFRWFEVSGGGE